MMFIASKALSFAIEPLFWVLLLLATGLLLMRRKPRLGRNLAWLALVALVLSGWTFVPASLIRNLESRHPPLPAGSDMTMYAGVVVLGGALSGSELWTVHKQVGLNDQAERMTEAVSLMQKYPGLMVVFSGGNSTVSATGLTESRRARIFFDQMGVPSTRVMYEEGSRNTYENAYYCAMMPGVDRTKPWLLLTSSFHMPRAMGVFEKIGWNVTPYPVDYRIAAAPSWYDFSLHYGPGTWWLALHELLGYFAYKWSGKL